MRHEILDRKTLERIQPFFQYGNHFMSILNTIFREKERAERPQDIRIVESVVRSHRIPYSKGKVFYRVDPGCREITVFVPVRRITMNVSKALLEIQDELERQLRGWRVEVMAKISPQKMWRTRDLKEIRLK